MKNEFVISLIKEYIEAYDEEFDKEVYLKYINKIGKQSATEISENMDLIKGFLYDWGTMWRVLGRARYKGWENRLGEVIRKYSDRLEVFRHIDLAEADLKGFKDDIRELYDSFRNIVGNIAAAKTLHVICPNFFPLWDNSIAHAIAKIGSYPENDYYRFMLKIQEIVKKYEEVFSKIAEKDGESKLRVIDKFLWYFTHKPLVILK